MKKRDRFFLCTIIPMIVVFFLFHTFPLLKGGMYSFTNFRGFGDFDFIGLMNFKDLFTDIEIKDVKEDGDKVKVGDTLVEFDMNAIKNEGYELITPVIITNTMEYLEIVPKDIKSVNTGETLITIL